MHGWRSSWPRNHCAPCHSLPIYSTLHNRSTNGRPGEFIVPNTNAIEQAAKQTKAARAPGGYLRAVSRETPSDPLFPAATTPWRYSKLPAVRKKRDAVTIGVEPAYADESTDIGQSSRLTHSIRSHMLNLSYILHQPVSDPIRSTPSEHRQATPHDRYHEYHPAHAPITGRIRHQPFDLCFRHASTRRRTGHRFPHR